MAGLSDTGFTVKRLNDIIAELKAKAESEFASLVEPGDIVNTSDTSVLGRFIKLFSAPLADLWEAAQDVYSAYDINQASGNALENITLTGGVARLSATASTAELVCYGDYGTIIPVDSNVRSTSTGKIFSTDSEITLDEELCVAVQIAPAAVANSTAYSFTYQISGINAVPVTVTITSDGSATESEIVNAIIAEVNTNHDTYLTATLVGSEALIQEVNQGYTCTFDVGTDWDISKVKKGVSATCTETGPNAQSANTIQSIQSPVIGWDTVTNPSAAVEGTNIETDSELRTRYALAKFQDSVNTYEAIYAAVLKIDGVEQIIIYENETDTALISPPVPAHSFYPIVLGGSSIDIAKAIWDNKPAGILSYGTVVESVTDNQGVIHTISFDRPTDLPIYVEVDVTTDSAYPANGDDQIKQAIYDYINGLKIGEDVIYSRLYTPINTVAGHYVTALKVDDVNPPVATTNVTVDYYKRATITLDDIVVNS